MGAADPTVDQFATAARTWLEGNAKRSDASGDQAWGVGRLDVSVFHALSDEQELALLDDLMAWQRLKYDAGYAAISWPVELGGRGLSADHERAFDALESKYETPRHHETFSVTTRLVAPTIREFGTRDQRERILPRMLRTEDLCCQLFSEPEAGSDLAGLRTRAVRDGDEWVINGQKVWSSGARFSVWGELICRTDVDVAKHAGLTAFIIPMDAEGITIRPIRQMSGGASFNEVFFDDVRIPDAARIGEVGDGWKITLATLAFERSASGSERGASQVGGSWRQVIELAHALGVTDDMVVRQRLAHLYTLHRLHALGSQRAQSESLNGQSGALGSIGKLRWTQWLTAVSDTVSGLLGPRLTADTGSWGTFEWTDHLLGAPGYRIAGGSDEIQRNIIGERVLGLPPEPKVDRGMPFSTALVRPS